MNRAALTAELSELKIRPLLERSGWRLLCDDSFRTLFERWGLDDARIIPTEVLAEKPRLEGGPAPVVVCTEKPEGPLQRQLKDLGVQSMGLFSQLVPRLAAGLPARYAPPVAGEARLEFAILCSGRCGSTLVARELREAGVGDAVEHLRPPVRCLLRHRDVSRFDFTRWWELVRAGHRVDGVFGTKIIYGFWEFAEEFLTDEERRRFLEFLGASRVLYIRRRDRVAQAVSDFIAGRTGFWHLRTGVAREEYAAIVGQVDADLAEMIAIYDRYGRHEQKIQALIRSTRAQSAEIDYEDLVADPKATVARIVGEFGREVPSGYAAAPLALESTSTQRHVELRDQLMTALRRRGGVDAT
jgi:LPS sulfotransferase NodH